MPSCLKGWEIAKLGELVEADKVALKLKIRGLILSQLPRLLTTRFHLVPTCEQTFYRNSNLGTNFNSCPAKFMTILFTTCV
jgi:hypothetical protein